jgi:hypothetical protein
LIYASFAFTTALFIVEEPSAPKTISIDVNGFIAAGSAVNAAWLAVEGAVGILIFQPPPTAQVTFPSLSSCCFPALV